MDLFILKHRVGAGLVRGFDRFLLAKRHQSNMTSRTSRGAMTK
jgi:hypothetical protein